MTTEGTQGRRVVGSVRGRENPHKRVNEGVRDLSSESRKITEVFFSESRSEGNKMTFNYF